MQNMILPKCAWANIQTTVGYTKHTHTHTLWALSKGEERQSGWWVLCVNKEKKIFKKNREK